MHTFPAGVNGQVVWYGKGMSLRCTKAIIAVAGFGTRWLPLTTAIEKCMLPVGNRPVIDYIVDDCVAAGIEDIYFVVGEQSTQIRSYYGHNPALEAHLQQKGKTKELERLKRIRTKANFHFVVQGANLPYGTAVPVGLCRQYIGPNEQAVVIMGDNFIANKDGESEVAFLMRETKAAGATAGMDTVHVPRAEVHKYGIVETAEQNGRHFFKHIVERPSVEEAKGTLSNVSMYIFDSDMFDCLQHVKPTKGEYYVVDALDTYANRLGKQLAVVATKGEYLDCGTVEGWLHANQHMTRHSTSLKV